MPYYTHKTCVFFSMKNYIIAPIGRFYLWSLICLINWNILFRVKEKKGINVRSQNDMLQIA